ncbi:MAG: hypothetical protein OK456_04945 [Thaumarchaeota archaeon]|nr:hypothetical protein [Nitrososphaerota archaeon]
MSMRQATGTDHGSNGSLLGSIIIIIIVMTVVTTTLTYSAPLALQSSSTSISSTSSSSSANLGITLAWGTTSSYPVNEWTSSCVASSGYIYCVGGNGGESGTTALDSVYYAQLSGSGVGPWMNTTAYPTVVTEESCVTSSNTIYCIGGSNGSSTLNQVYYASLSGEGVGSWESTTAYPVGLSYHSCAASDTGVYCVGGGDDLYDLSATANVYYAPFSEQGLGSWSAATDYPIAVRQQSCVATNTDLFCFGGRDETGVYYAPITPSGLGPWANTTGYPFTVGANLMSCVPVGTSVYCVAGHTGANVSSAVYGAQLSSTGVGRWVRNTDYPQPVWGASCVSTDQAIYCVGGEETNSSITNGVAFAPV